MALITPIENPNPMEAFSQAASAVAQMQLDQARRQELKMRAASQYAGANKIGQTSSFQLGQPQPPAVGNEPPTDASGLLPAPPPPMPPEDVMPQVGSMQPLPKRPPMPPGGQGPVPLPPTVPSQASQQGMPPTGQGTTPPQINMDQIQKMRQAIHSNLQQFPNLTMRDLIQTFGNDATAQKTAQQILGFGPLDQDVIQRLSDISNVSLPNYQGVTGTETLPAQKEHELTQEFATQGNRVFAPGAPVEAGPESTFGQNITQAGPQVAESIYGNEARMAMNSRRMDLMAQKMVSNNDYLKQLAANYRAAIQPGSLVDPAQRQAIQDSWTLAQAIIGEGGVENLTPEEKQLAQKYPQVVDESLKAANPGGASQTVRTSTATKGGGKGKPVAGLAQMVPRLTPSGQAYYAKYKALGASDDEIRSALIQRGEKGL